MQTVKRNWKTTLTGVFMLAMTGVTAAANPAILGDPQTISAILAGIGLILAKDGSGSNIVH